MLLSREKSLLVTIPKTAKDMKIKAYGIALLLVLFTTLGLKGQEVSKNKYEIRNLGETVNNKQSNFGTSYYGNQLIFASPEKRNYIISNMWDPNQQPYLDLYVGKVDVDGSLKEVKNFSKKINTTFHEGDACFTKNLKRVYFTRNNYNKGKFVTDRKGLNQLQLYTAIVGADGKWTNIQPLPFNNRNYSTGHPALSHDERTLYFVSNKPGGYGNTDLYKVEIIGDNQYGEPQNLGDKINTSGREMFPYVTEKSLYYSSDGILGGKGGLDVYEVKFEKDTLTTPLNLINLNSSWDDFAFIINKSTEDGYFSSNRPGGYGDDDIYYFKEKEYYANRKCIYNVYVSDNESAELLKSAQVKVLLGDKVLAKGFTDKKGHYVYEQPCKIDEIYRIESKLPVYGSSIVPTTPYDGTNPVQDVRVRLQKEFHKSNTGKLLVRINPIYFDYNSAIIRFDASIELDKVVRIMKKYPLIRIEAGSYTDARGRKSYNRILSRRRAKSTADYIISRGISPSRIIYRGYGESNPVNGCVDGVRCTDAEYQMNRRTEFAILNPEVLDQ